MSLRNSSVMAVVLFAALTTVACSPPLIRCETDEHCTEDMKCDVRQGLCVDKGDYIETPTGTGTGDNRDCLSQGGASGENFNTAQAQQECLSGQMPSGEDR